MAMKLAPYFRLLPRNEAASRIVLHPRNTSFLENEGCPDRPSFRVTLGHSPKRRGTLLSLGKEDCDIYLTEQCLSQHQCHFRIHPDTCELILRDDSPTRTTRLIFDANTSQKYSLQGFPRQRVISRKIQAIIYMYIYDAIFELRFPAPGQEIKHDAILNYVECNGLKPWSGPRGRKKCALQELPNQGRIVYEKKRCLGQGSYGDVFLIADLRTGDHFAVKQFDKLANETEEEQKRRFQKEVGLLRAAAHSNIARFVHAQESENGTTMELFMDVYQGNLQKLIQQSPAPSIHLKSVTKQMLDALAFLAKKNIIHRDVKSENILHDASMVFYLADFGISKEQNNTLSPIGTASNMAPEMFCALPQTSKADIFSMGLVMLEVLRLLPACEIRNMPDDYQDWHDSIRSVASRRRPEILPMLEKHSDERYTAARCLTWFFAPDSVGGTVFQPMQMHESLSTKTQADTRDPSRPTETQKHGSSGKVARGQELAPTKHLESHTELKQRKKQSEPGNSQTKPPTRGTTCQVPGEKNIQAIPEKQSNIHHSIDARKQHTSRTLRPMQAAGTDRPQQAHLKKEEDFKPCQERRKYRPQRPTIDVDFPSRPRATPSNH